MSWIVSYLGVNKVGLIKLPLLQVGYYRSNPRTKEGRLTFHPFAERNLHYVRKGIYTVAYFLYYNICISAFDRWSLFGYVTTKMLGGDQNIETGRRYFPQG